MATNKDFIVKNGLDVGGDVEAAGSGSFVGLDVTGNVVLGGTVNPQITLNDTSTSNLIHTITSGSDKLQISTDPNQVHVGSRIEFLVDATERAQITDVGMDVTGNLTASGDLTVTGDLTVNGTSTTLNVATLDVEDKNITLNFGAGDTSASAGGAGITIQDAVDASNDASILWNTSSDGFDFSHAILTKGGGDNQVYFTGGNDSTSGRQLTLSTEAAGSQNNAIHRLTVPSGYGSFNVTVNAKERFKINNNGDISSYNDASTNAVKMLWDASHESLNIGDIGSSTDRRLNISGSGPQTATTQYGVVVNPTMSDDVTGSIYNIYSQANVASGASLTNLYSIYIGATTLNGSSVTDSYGLYQAGSEKNYFAGKVGIGTDSPEDFAVGPFVVGDGTTVQGMTIYTGASHEGIIRFADGTSGAQQYEGQIKYDHSDNKMRFFTDHVERLRITSGGYVGINTGSNDPNALLHISDTSPHIDVGPHGGNRAKFGYHNLDVIIGSTSSTGSIIFKNNIGSTDSPQTSGDVKMTIADGNVDIANKLGVNIASDSTAIFRAGWASSGITRPGTLYSAMIETNSDQDGLGLFTTDNRNVRIIFGSPTNNVGGQIVYYTDTSTPYMKFFTKGSEVMALKEGKVGIGTDAPVQTLDVDGSIGTRQVRHSIRPTLNLDFANSKELDSRITFYRDSIATYYDSKGVLKYANVNEPRFDHDPLTGESKGLLIEEARTNVLTKSAHMHTWPFLVSNNQFIEANAAVAPDGTFSAMKYTAITPPGSDTRQWLYQLTPSSANSYANKTVTGSFWARSDTNLSWQCHITDNVSGSSYNYSTTTEWQRFSFVKTCAASSPGVGLYPVFVGSETKSVYLWGGMIEEGGFATSDIPSDTSFTSRASTATYHDETGILRTAPVNGARYGYKYDGRKWVETGLILESAGTNLFTLPQSTFQSGSWIVQANVTLTPNYAVAPDGSFTACRYQDSALVGDVIYRSMVSSTNTSNRYTASCYAKANGTSEFELRIDMPTLYKATFDLSNGTITQQTAGINAFMENVGNGWYRCSISTTFNDDITNFVVSGDVDSANDDILIWGAMCETGMVATSFVYEGTRAADVYSSVTYTRNTDIAKIYNFSDHFNSEELTAYVHASSDFEPETNSRYYEAASIEGNTDDRMLSYYNTQYRWLWKSNGVNDVVFSNADTWSNFNEIKQAATWKNGVANLADSTGNSQSDTSAGSESIFTVLHIGNDTTETSAPCAHFKKLAFYEKALSSAELVALTENN